ncbi:MAG TPA: VOC family protein [Candidatus Nitrosotalea sp.]|nr:VOC family protein [Candidatus Nitrosotalea sp.]
MDDSSAFHHLSMPAYRVGEMADFYRRVLNLRDVKVESGSGSPRETVVLEIGGGRELHLTRPVPSLLFDNGQFVNPILHGHTAFRVSSLDAVEARLAEMNIRYANYGDWAIPGCHQVFFHDPEGNVVEAHEIRSPSQK